MIPTVRRPPNNPRAFVPSPLSLHLPLDLPIELDVNYADVFTYDPAEEEPEGANMLRMISYVQEDRRTYVRCRLTAPGNAELRKHCHTKTQKEVWEWPASELFVQLIGGTPCISEHQVCFGF